MSRIRDLFGRAKGAATALEKQRLRALARHDAEEAAERERAARLHPAQARDRAPEPARAVPWGMRVAAEVAWRFLVLAAAPATKASATSRTDPITRINTHTDAFLEPCGQAAQVVEHLPHDEPADQSEREEPAERGDQGGEPLRESPAVQPGDRRLEQRGDQQQPN